MQNKKRIIALLIPLLAIPFASGEYLMKASKVNFQDYVKTEESSGGGSLQTYGPNNSISFLGTNGLTAASFSASSVYGGTTDPAHAAFDNWGYSGGSGYDQYHSDEDMGFVTTREARGIWQATSAINQWLQVDWGVGKSVTVNGIIYKSYANGHGRPYQSTIQVSDDGINFTDVQDLDFRNSGATETYNLTTPATGRYFRIFFKNTWNSNWVTVSDMELF